MIGATALLVVAGLGVGLAVTRAIPDDALAPDALAPDVQAPSALSAKSLSPTSVELEWKGSGNVDSYIVKVGSDRDLAAGTTKLVTSRTTRLTLSDLAATTPGIDQYYRIEAVRDGKVAASRVARFRLQPGKVSTVDVTRTATNGVRVTWKKVPNARQFDIQIGRNKRFTKDVNAVRTIRASTTFVRRGLTPATTYWIAVRPVNGDQTGTFSKPVKFTTRVRKTAFRVGTWNVCSEKCSGYAGRARIMAGFLNANQIDMFGLQESGGQRVGRTTNAIFSGGSQKFQRATGGAEARYIFYRPALFRQLSGGYFPVGDGRHATWAKFTVRETGRIFYFVDVHLENGKSGSADARRSREMSVMLGRMASINDTGKPIVYAGDFNSGRHRPADSPGVKMRAAGLEDSRYLAASPLNAGINTGHTFATTVLASGAHVDHIFVSKQFDVAAWKQLVRLSGNRYTRPVVSDHNALSAVLALDSTPTKLGNSTATTTVPVLPSSLR